MQTIKTMDGQEYLLDDEQAENVKKAILTSSFLQLQNGDMINTKSVSKVGSLDKVKHWGGYVLRKDGRSFLRDGDIIWLDGNEEIEEIDDPKYKLMPIINLKQLK